MRAFHLVVPILLMTVGGQTGCAPERERPTAPPPMALSSPAGPTTGVVLVVRAVTAAVGGGLGDGWRGLLLASADAGAASPAGPLSEIIVRQKGGALISVVQPADAALRAGAPVSIGRPLPAVAGRVTVARL